MAAEIIPLNREKVLLDTSVYINHLNKGFYEDPIFALIRSSVLYLHSIVFEELLAGARSEKELRELDHLKKPFSKTGRIITPTDEDWEASGKLVQHFIHKKSMDAKQAVALTHDILLALSSRRLGIRVITENKKDFERIQNLKNFKLTVWRPEI